MEKRLLLFWMMTGLIFLGYFQLQQMRQPDLPPAADQAADPGAELDDDAAPPGDPQQPPAAELADGSHEPPRTQAEISDGTIQELDELNPLSDAPPLDAASLERVVLGSLDPDSAYRMAVYCSNLGGSIERIELNAAAYVDLEDKVGYLGYLALDEGGMQGCVIGTVANGSPAALAACATAGVSAGLRPGDRLIGLNGEAIHARQDVTRLLASTTPGSDVQVVVSREEGGAPRELAFTATLSRRPLAVVQRFDRAAQDVELESVANPAGINSFLLSFHKVANKSTPFGKDEIESLPSLRDGYWSVEQPDVSGVVFRRRLTPADLQNAGLTGSWEVVKRYTLAQVDPEDASSGYHLDFEFEFHNLSKTKQQFAWRLDGCNGLPLEGWWYLYKTHPSSFGAAGARDIVYREPGGPHQMITAGGIVKQAEKDPESPELPVVGKGTERLDYIGVDTQYFCVVLKDGEENETGGFAYKRAAARSLNDVTSKFRRRANSSYRLESDLIPVEPNGVWKHAFQIYAGPKKSTLLEGYGLEDCIVYGWFWFVAWPLTLLLHTLYWGSYGLAIVLLTVIVRGCMFPLSRHQVANAKRMQELGPEMQQIAKKYKNDMEARAKAQRELFQKHKINPLSGCLPAFLQLPIFIGLYRCLSVDIALRGAPLLPGFAWCANLAAPDQLLDWSGFMPQWVAGPNGWLGPYLNVLPLISVGLFLVQQKMFTPPPADEQQEVQQKMMSFMTLFMGVLFFKVPSGLCLYFISSSLWGLLERQMLPKNKPATTEAESGAVAKGKQVLEKLMGKETRSNGDGKRTAAERKRRRAKRK